MTRELLQQALDALETCTPGDYSTGHVIHPSYGEHSVDEAIEAIRAYLAQPQGEPAWHPAPTCAGTWILSLDSGMEVQENITQHEIDIEATWPGGHWFGPIPQEPAP